MSREVTNGPQNDHTDAFHRVIDSERDITALMKPRCCRLSTSNNDDDYDDDDDTV